MAKIKDFISYKNFNMFRYENNFYVLKQIMKFGRQKKVSDMICYAWDYINIDADILRAIVSAINKMNYNKIYINFISNHSYGDIDNSYVDKSIKLVLTKKQVNNFHISSGGPDDSYFLKFNESMKVKLNSKTDIFDEVVNLLSDVEVYEELFKSYKGFISDNMKRFYNGIRLDPRLNKIKVETFFRYLCEAFRLDNDLTYLITKFMFDDENQYLWINYPQNFFSESDTYGNTYDYRQYKQISLCFEDLIFHNKQGINTLNHAKYALLKTNTVDKHKFDFKLNGEDGDFKVTTRKICLETAKSFFNKHEYVYLLILHMKEQKLVLYKKDNDVISKEYSVNIGFRNLIENFGNAFDFKLEDR